MGSRLEKIEEISAQLKDKYQQTRELQERLSELNREAESLENAKIKNTILGNIENGNVPIPSTEREKLEEKMMDEEDYEKLEEEGNMRIGILKKLETMYYHYGEEYVLPMGEFGFTPEDDWDGYDTVKSGIVINVNGSYIVDGQYKFDTLEELKQWAQTEYADFMSINNNDFESSLRVEENKEEKELLKLQEEFEQGLIKEEDLSQEQVDKLEELYNKQIEELNQSLLGYKKKIISIKKQLAS